MKLVLLFTIVETYTESRLNTPFLRRLGEHRELGEKNTFPLTGGYKSGFGIRQRSLTKRQGSWGGARDGDYDPN
jgi:hypothetical protein